MFVNVHPALDRMPLGTSLHLLRGSRNEDRRAGEKSSGLEVMASTEDLAPCEAEKREARADDEHDDADRPENGDRGDKADDEKDYAEDNQGGAPDPWPPSGPRGIRESDSGWLFTSYSTTLARNRKPPETVNPISQTDYALARWSGARRGRRPQMITSGDDPCSHQMFPSGGNRR